MMYNSMQSGNTSSLNAVTQRPGIPGNPAGSMHDYGGGARPATASGGYGTMDPNFNNNNPYIGNNGSVVENIKGFECSDLDNSLLAGARTNTANAGSIAMQSPASYGMQQCQNNSITSGGVTMQQQQYSSYGCMQASTGPTTATNGQNFEFGGNQSQSDQMQMPTHSRMFNSSSDYAKQQISATNSMGHGVSGNSRGMAASMTGQMNENAYNTDTMSNSRRLSTPASAMSSNASQSYLQRSNSYPANNSFVESNQHFPPSSTGTNITGYPVGRNASNYQEQNFNPSMPNSAAIRNRSYSTGCTPNSYTSGNHPTSGSWAESHPMQSKIPFSGTVAATSGSRNMYRQSSSGISQQSSPQVGISRGMRYPAQRAQYTGTNSEMQGNQYGNTSMQTPSNFHSGKSVMGMNYSDRNSMGGQSSMPYSQSMSQLQTPKNVGMDADHVGAQQKLRHYGPMPHAGSAQRMPYSSSQSPRGMNHFPNQSSRIPYGSQSSSSMEQFQGGFQGQYPGHNQLNPSVSRRTMTSSGMNQCGASMPELTNNNTNSDPYYNRTMKPDAFTCSPQDPIANQEMYASQFPVPNSQQNQFDTYGSTHNASFSNFPQTVPENVSAAQTRKNMIFSAELEKLARLSRNPMLDNEFPLPVHETAPLNMTPTTPPVMPCTNGQMPQNYQSNQSSMISNPISQSSGRQSVPNVYNNMTGPLPQQHQQQQQTQQQQQQPAPPVNSSAQMDQQQSYSSPVSSAPPTPVMSQSMTSVQRATPERTTASSAPATPATVQDFARQTNSAEPNVHSSGSAAACPSVSKASPGEVKKDENVQPLQKLSQSLKDKQDEITKANPNHREYLSDNNVPAGQNCIAALSAACRNMIADMDNPSPKQKSVQSPLHNKSSDSMNIASMRAPSVPGSVVSGGQLTPGSDVSMSSMSGQGASTPLGMHMDSFNSPPGYGNTMGTDFQTQYHDFLEQSVPMPIHSKQLTDKVRKPRKRRKSEDLMDSGSNPAGAKKRKPRKKTQNPSSVESLETVQSLDNISECTTLSDSHRQLGDDCRSASQTPTSVPSSWCPNDTRMSNMDSSLTCLGGNPLNQSSQMMDTDQSTQDFLDSVFSPDTTMSNIMQDVVAADSVMMGHINPNHHSPTSSHASHHSNNDNMSVASYQSHTSLPTPNSHNSSLINLDQSQTMGHSNAPMTNGPAGHLSGQANNTVSSSGDPVSTTSVPASGDRNVTSPSDKQSMEAHPLEILQAQIQLQRQQFNLSDSRPLPIRDPAARKMRPGNNIARKTGTTCTLPGEVDVDVLMAEKDSTWYVPNEQQKEPEVPWEQTRKTTGKGRNSTSLWPPSDMKVYLL